MKKTLFIYSGEGTHSAETQFRLLKKSSLWPEVTDILKIKLNIDIEQLWNQEIGRHKCPYSPLLTAVSQICLSDIWQQWGYHPDIVVGHSTGELAAAYQAGLYSLEEVLLLAYRIGEIASLLEGAMVHGLLSDNRIADLPLNISSFNFYWEEKRHLTLCGFKDEIEAFIREHPEFVKMKLPHPWHHPEYRRFSDKLISFASAQVEQESFVSGVTARFETRLSSDYWHRWLVNPIDFIQTLETVKARYDDCALDIIEIGFHPVLEKCCKIFREYTYVSSMFRGEDDIRWILHQRKKLPQNAFLGKLKEAIDMFKPGLDYDTGLAYQGLDSLEFTRLSLLLQTLFPSLSPQDFYRYKTIRQLIDKYGVDRLDGVERAVVHKWDKKNVSNDVVIAAMSCRFPSSVETLTQFWDVLLSREDQVKSEAGRGNSEAGFLSDAASRFDHRYFNIPQAEARTMDPQQILALELTEMLWKDAGIDPESLDKNRIGVYIGVWSQEYQGDRTSVYYPTGTNPSMVAARISYHYDLRGPSWVTNTACSSSLVAVHYAAKDIEAGRVDYAIAGGVNLLLDEIFTANMRNSGFLSKDNRCKAFDNDANGYVRAEGGGLVLLMNKSLAENYYAQLTGSAINQNGGRSQLVTAPHPDAQEELINRACKDAGIDPREVAYVECHGTGTKIGDPIEISAIQNTIAGNRTDTCHIGSVKSNMGHLESAAGIAGLIKSVTALNHGVLPPNLHLNKLNSYIDFESHNINVVTRETAIDQEAICGISSFGFGGSNAHVVIKGAEASLRKEIRPLEIPFDREQSYPLGSYLRLEEPAGASPSFDLEDRKAGPDVRHSIRKLFFDMTGVEEISTDLELIEQGLDSMSATEFFHLLEQEFGIDIDPDILFEFPLFDQLAEELERRITDQRGPKALEPVTKEDDEVYALTGTGLN